MSKAKIRIFVAGGAANLINTANTLNIDAITRLFIIADGDNQTKIGNILQQNEGKYEVLVLNPNIETEWLFVSREEILSRIPDKSESTYFMEINKNVGGIDLNDLATKSKAFDTIFKEIGKSEKYT